MKPLVKIIGLVAASLTFASCGSSALSSSVSSATSNVSYFSYDSNVSYPEYLVTFVTNCDTPLDPITTSYIATMPILENGDLTLEGWFFDAEFTQYANFPLFVDRALTLHAHWITASDGFIYTPTLDGLGYMVEAYVGNATNLALPASYNGKPVLEIGEYLFYNNGSLLSIVLPSQLQTIGLAAFKNAASLTSIVLPNTVTTISADAFSGASALETIHFSSDLVSIGNNAFEWCSSLTAVDLPANLTEINSRAFADNALLTSVTLRATTPPLRFDSSFENAPSGLRYYVPNAVLTTYRTDNDWSAYADVILSL
jgi:hypothetical protein